MRLDTAGPIRRTATLTVLVAQMHFHAGDVVGKVRQLRGTGLLDVLHNGGVMRHVVVGLDLDLHRSLLRGHPLRLPQR
nr:hypothetical protein [Xanthomonas campestris]